jgi:hypothetical protein
MHYLECISHATAPLNPLIKTNPEFWDLELGKETAYTRDPSPDVDNAWNSISAPPGEGKPLMLGIYMSLTLSSGLFIHPKRYTPQTRNEIRFFQRLFRLSCWN